MPLTRTEIISDTVRLFPQRLTIPEANIDDYIKASVQELILLITNRQSNIPGVKTNMTKQALISLADTLGTNRTNIQQLEDTKNKTNIEKTIPDPQCATSEGGVSIKKAVKIQPLSNEEFEALLQSIPQKSNNIETKPLHQTQQALQHSQDNKKFERLPMSAKNVILTKLLQHQANHICNVNGHKESINTLLQGNDASIWTQSSTNELGRLAQGIDTIKGNDCIKKECMA